MKLRQLMPLLLAGAVPLVAAVTPDTISTSQGPLKITPIKHASVMLEFGGRVIHVDPWSQGDYTGLPKADVIFITDIHGDHMDPAKIAEIRKDGTVIVAPAAVAKTVTEATVINNGESKTIAGIQVEAIPMYWFAVPAQASSSTTRDAATDTCSRWAENGSISPATPNPFRK